MTYFIFAAIIILISGYLTYLYVFSIYEVKIEVSRNKIYTDGESYTLITVVPINSFGNRAPGRSVNVDFQITEGADLAEIDKSNLNKGIIVLKAKSKPGKVIILVKPDLAVFPTYVEILILPNLA
ncbi:MAG: hypothetical protein IAE91_10545 [Ignavibacteriaceae bacterium]|nr:hypothetical protein [Ignavibacteriaceae bacterium]